MISICMHTNDSNTIGNFLSVFISKIRGSLRGTLIYTVCTVNDKITFFISSGIPAKGEEILVEVSYFTMCFLINHNPQHHLLFLSC